MRFNLTLGITILPLLSASLYAQNTFTPEGGKWSTDFAVPGISGYIYATASDGNNLYVGGNFKTAGSIRANSIAMWDGNTWHSVGEGPENGVSGDIPSVEAMAFCDGKLFIGGQFSKAGTVAVNGIAYWDGTQWNKMGTDSTNGVRRQVVLGFDTLILRGFVYDLMSREDKVYVAGSFQFAGDSISNGMAIWNTSTPGWETPAHGIPKSDEHSYTTIFGLAADDQYIYAGGSFGFKPNDISARNIARWDGSEWSSMGEAASIVLELRTSSDGKLYATGIFPSEEDTTGGACGVGIWNGSEWISLHGPAGYKSHVSRINIFNNELYAAGTFSQEYVLPDQCMAKWNGSEWQIIEGLGQTYYRLHQAGIQCIQTTRDQIFVAGNFTRAGDIFPLNIAELDPETQSWKILDDGNANLGIHDGRIFALESKGDTVYAGGDFTVAGGILARGIAMWTGHQWQPLGHGDAEYNGISGMVYTILADSNNIYAGGYFDMAGGEAAFHIARWDGTKWWPVGIGVGGIPGAHVRALARNGDYLYAGGYFAAVGDEENYELPANSIARFNLKTNRWQTLGRGIEYVYGIPGTVYDLEVKGDTIYAGGEFYNADEMFNENFAVLVGDKWMSQDKDHEYGIKGMVLKIKSIGDDLYIGGLLKKETDDPSYGILRWKNARWETVGETLADDENDVLVEDIVEFDSGFVAGGRFTMAGDQQVNNLAYFDGLGWKPVTNGILPGVMRLAATDYDLFVAGFPQMFTADGLSMGMALLEFEPPVIINSNKIKETGKLFMVYPNPISQSAIIKFSIPVKNRVSIELFNAHGKLIRTLLNDLMPAGEGTIHLNTGSLESGIYFCRMVAGSGVETTKIIVSR